MSHYRKVGKTNIGMKNRKLFINIFISVIDLVSKKNDLFHIKTVTERHRVYDMQLRGKYKKPCFTFLNCTLKRVSPQKKEFWIQLSKYNLILLSFFLLDISHI